MSVAIKELLDKQNNPEHSSGVSKAKLHGANSSAQEGLYDISELDPDNIVGLYMKEMVREPLLTYAQEQQLGKQIARGRRAARKLREDNNDPATIAILKAEVQQEEKARNQLVKANTRLVVGVAKRYLRHGVPMLDLIQGGNMALIRAAEKFDYSRGYRFSTYATWWIRQGVTRTLSNQKRAIRVPLHMNDRINNLRALAAELEKAWARKPTVEELAQELEIEPKAVRFMLRVGKSSLSLEAPIKGENDTRFGDFVENTDAVNPAQEADQQLLKEKIEDLLLTLTPREARILRDRFGLYDRRPHTLGEIGEKFGLTRERIRQLERQALRKLRYPSRSGELRAYWR